MSDPWSVMKYGKSRASVLFDVYKILSFRSVDVELCLCAGSARDITWFIGTASSVSEYLIHNVHKMPYIYYMW